MPVDVSSSSSVVVSSSEDVFSSEDIPSSEDPASSDVSSPLSASGSSSEEESDSSPASSSSADSSADDSSVASSPRFSSSADSLLSDSLFVPASALVAALSTFASAGSSSTPAAEAITMLSAASVVSVANDDVGRTLSINVNAKIREMTFLIFIIRFSSFVK